MIFKSQTLVFHTMVNRNQISKIKELLANFPCVVLLGARQVGKSTILKQLFPKAKIYDLEKEIDFNRINNNPDLFFNEIETKPIIIDEAQLSNNLFKSLRVAIDSEREQTGQFLLTGSSSPELLKNISESLAGRVAIMEIPSLGINEAYEIKESKFAERIEDLSKLKKLKPNLERKQFDEFNFYGSYPEPFLKRKNTLFYDEWYENYVKTYIERDIRSLFPTLNLQAFKRFFTMLAYSSGELINASNFARSLDVSQPTIKKYLEIAEGTFTWRSLNCYDKNTKKRLVKTPRGHLRDIGLINYFLNIGSIENLKSHPHYGRIWESFIIEEIIKSISNHHSRVKFYFYRTHNQSEIDLIIETKNSLIPIEIKSGSNTDIRKLQSLSNFIEEQKCPYGILINKGEEIFMLSENIIQIPATYL